VVHTNEFARTEFDNNELLGTMFALISVLLFLGLSEDVTITRSII
jgi:hypothetical protein